MIRLLIVICVFAFSSDPLLIANSLGSDFNDGICDDAISTSDDLNREVNMSFIKRNAKAKAASKVNDYGRTAGVSDVVQGGAIIKDGANVEGDVIVIYTGNRNTVINSQ